MDTMCILNQAHINNVPNEIKYKNVIGLGELRVSIKIRQPTFQKSPPILHTDHQRKSLNKKVRK